MESLHRRIILLIIWLGFFYNIERLDITHPDTINLMSSVYIVGTIASLLPLVPLIRRIRFVYLIILISVLHIALLLISSAPIIGGIYTYLTITSYAMILVTLVLSHRVGQSTREFQHAVEHITFSDINTRLRNLDDAEELIDIQMLSSRRAHRPLSIILFETDTESLDMTTHRLVQDIQESMMQRYVVSSMAGLISQHMRRTDLMARDTYPGRLLLIAPETPHEHVTIMAQRLKQIIHGRLGITATFSTATFPQHALTFEKLRDIAEQNLVERQTVQIEEKEPDGYSRLNGSEQTFGFPDYTLTPAPGERRASDEAVPVQHARRHH